MKVRIVTLLSVALASCQSFTDVTQAKPYACEWLDGGSGCPTGWVCGYDNRCFDPAVPTGLRTCANDGHCFTGWKCDDDNRCFNPAIESPRACRTSADCATSWRCGFDQHCQDTRVARAYACASDEHCEQNWRCDLVAQVCLAPPSPIAPKPGVGVTGKLLSPLITNGVPSHAAIGAFNDGQGADRALAFIADGGLFVVVESQDAQDDDGISDLSRGRVRRFPIDSSTVAELVAADDSAIVRTTTGRVDRYSIDGGISTVLSSGARRIRQTSYPNGASRGAADFGWYSVTQDTIVPSSTTLPSVPAPLTVPGLLDQAIILGASAQSVWVGEQGLEWYKNSIAQPVRCPIDMFPPNTRSGNCHNNGYVLLDAGVRFEQLLFTLTSTGNPLVGVVLRTADGGTAVGAGVIGTAPGDTEPSLLSTTTACQACVDNQPPLQTFVSIDKTGGQPVIVTRCPGAVFDAGILPERTWRQPTSSGDQCRFSFSPVPSEQSLPPMRGQVTDPARRALIGANGSFWFNDAPQADDGFYPSLSLVPGLLVEVPQVVVRLTGAHRGIYAITTDYLYSQSVMGFSTWRAKIIESAASFSPIGAVQGHADWILATTGVFNGSEFPLGAEQPRQMVALAPNAPPLRSPGTAFVQQLADGSPLLIVTSADELFSANLASVINAQLATPVPLLSRLVPLAGQVIKSFVADTTPRSRADAGVSAPYLTGFANTSNAVFEIVATTDINWASRTLQLPSGAVPVELWKDESSVRLGLASGVVMALPDRVPLSEVIPNGAATDFAQLCGTTLALSGGALWQLQGKSDGLAQWVKLGTFGASAADMVGARMFEEESGVFLATPSGRLTELTAGRNGARPSCP